MKVNEITSLWSSKQFHNASQANKQTAFIELLLHLNLSVLCKNWVKFLLLGKLLNH